ncbi:MAG: glycosyltransferase [Tepidisphaeraceae bacterium]|jgi:hypothetical protein
MIVQWAVGHNPPLRLAGRRAIIRLFAKFMTEPPLFSIVTCSIDPAKFTRVTEMYHQVLAGQAHEVVGIHDARSLAEGYNRGIEAARGQIIIFSHDDVEFLCPIGDRIVTHLQDYDLLGVAGATRLEHPMWSYAGPPYIYGQVANGNSDGTFNVEIFATPLRVKGGIVVMDGLCLIAHRRVLEKVQFDAERFTGFHLYDTDFTFSAHLAGFRLAVCCDLPMIHYSRGLINADWHRYAERFYAKRSEHIEPYRRRRFRVCEIQVHTKQDVLEVMTPPHWT